MRTSELIGPALDWAVAKAEGGNVWMGDWYAPHDCVFKLARYPASVAIVYAGGGGYSPSTDWAQGGPIIDREDISFRKYHNPKSEAHGTYYAKVCRESGAMVHWSKRFDSTGPTSLIAAMRCFVASKLGDDVEVPEELR